MVPARPGAETDLTMRISRPAAGTAVTTQDGERVSVTVDDDGTCRLYTEDSCGFDAPAWEVVLNPDEAARLAEMLLSARDRAPTRGRRLDATIGERAL
ncbi:hypothetical protein SAMN04489835_0592 [Mycolicibacterium rutilum]|uniref:Potassium/proton antiporter subunit KhtT-like N-terminal domain-containing protein n=2 Tax=Mycolicibacterium rutilum TaxID=370526 RepID=A0A1H6IKQ7_MYCRU|nr:hypothetical protein SAMN04489835_0592 [Mycolicibacterium rutilum]